ncbi:MAG TPA: hypothetical protein VGB37_01180 [Candidatus Lokiarchaeia archaeon]
MKIVVCKECGYSFNDNREPGEYYCSSCQKFATFYKLEVFCGAKPGVLYEKKP